VEKAGIQDLKILPSCTDSFGRRELPLRDFEILRHLRGKLEPDTYINSYIHTFSLVMDNVAESHCSPNCLCGANEDCIATVPANDHYRCCNPQYLGCKFNMD
jgi:hypothetical protein